MELGPKSSTCVVWLRKLGLGLINLELRPGVELVFSWMGGMFGSGERVRLRGCAGVIVWVCGDLNAV